MITETIDRAGAVVGTTDPIVVGAAALDAPTERATRDASRSPRLTILEPFGRNTAPAVAMAALASNGDDLLLVLPADHVITATDRFEAAVSAGATLAERGHLVTFGITPTAPETGYGYIRAGTPLGEAGFEIDEFKEKPDLETATAYVASGDFSWNSGMFLLRAGTYLEELKAHQPDIAEAAARTWEASNDGSPVIHLDPDSFGTCRSMSIDHAVMEHSDRGAVIPADLGWSDVGSWQSLWEIAAKDDDGNALVGDVVSTDLTNSYVRGDSRLVAVAGLESVVIVDTPDALLVGSLASSQDVRTLVDELRASGRKEAVHDRTRFEPWGTVTTVAEGSGFRVDELTIDPGGTPGRAHADTSLVVLQVVAGTASVGVEGTDRTVQAGDAFHVPQGRAHSIRNDRRDPLRVRVITVDTENAGS